MYSISSISDEIQLGLLHLPDYTLLTGISAKRELEKGATLFLLEKLFSTKVDLQYTSEGKPFVANKNCHISITHSHDKLAILTNIKHPCGIDIELIRDKVLRIQHKFLSEIELSDANNNTEKLITYWACKEALYKYYSKKEVDFIEHLFIHPFEQKDSFTATGEIRIDNFLKKVELHCEKMEDYMLVYTLDEVK